MRIVAAFLALFVAAPALAQEATPLASASWPEPKNTITVNPLALAFGTISIEYERAVTPNMSLFVGPQYAMASTGGVTASAYGASLGLRFFTSPHAPRGFFLSPNGSLAFASAGSGSASALAYTAGLLAGYTWLIGDAFDISIGGGAQYVHLQVQDSAGEQIGVDGVAPALRLALGGAF